MRGDQARRGALMHIHSIQLLYTISGFVIGALTGVTGTGGGALMTPVLILFFGIHPVTAVGTDLLYAFFTKASGTVVHAYNRTVDWKVVGWMAAGSLPATAVTLLGLYYLDVHGDATQNIVTKILGLALFLTAISLLFRKQL